MSQLPPAVYLMGPTGAGKTELALRLAKELPFEIINVDSAQIYRHMNIGTAKPPEDWLRAVPHRLIDIREPHETYSAAEFRRDALEQMGAICGRGKIPLLVGGTMFYFHALEHGLDVLPAADQALRGRFAARARRLGWPALHQELAAVDPISAARIAPNDGQRIQRALEVHRLTGSPLPSAGVSPTRTPYRIYKLALSPTNRAVLHRSLAARFSCMLDQGLLEEVRGLLHRREMTENSPSLRTVGYRQAVEYLAGKVGYNEMMERAVASTRQLAKRQLTWLRNQRGVVWIDSFHAKPCAGRGNLVVTYLDGKLADWNFG